MTPAKTGCHIKPHYSFPLTIKHNRSANNSGHWSKIPFFFFRIEKMPLFHGRGVPISAGLSGGSRLGAVCGRGRRGAYFLRYVFSGPKLLKLLKHRLWWCEINVTWLCSSVRCFVFYHEGRFENHREKKNTLNHPTDVFVWEGGYSGRCFILKGRFKATNLCSKTAQVGSSPCREAWTRATPAASRHSRAGGSLSHGAPVRTKLRQNKK